MHPHGPADLHRPACAGRPDRHTGPCVAAFKETARRYEGCHDGLAVLASSRLASRGIPDNADESGRTPSLRVSDLDQRCRNCLRPSRTPVAHASVPSRSPLRAERSEKRTLGIRSLFTIRVTRRSRPASTYGDNTVLLYFSTSKPRLYLDIFRVKFPITVIVLL